MHFEAPRRLAPRRCSTLSTPPSQALQSPPTPMRILVAEDETTSRETLRFLLSPYGQCDVAADGSDARRRIAAAIDSSAPYDLIFLDILMPGMSGEEVLAELRRMECASDCPVGLGATVIMTTTLDSPKQVMRSFNLGCEHYLVKPINAPALEKALAGLGIRATSSEPPLLDFGALDQLSGQIGGADGALIRTLAEGFRQEMEEAMEALKRFPQDQDRDALRQAAHRAASAAQRMGAARSAQHLRALEEAAGGDKAIESDLSSLCEILRNSAKAVIDHVQEAGKT